MWIDIGMTVLLTLRITLLRPALPQLLDPNNDAWLAEETDEQQSACSLRRRSERTFSSKVLIREQWGFRNYIFM
jgi:hypothetical protein